MRFRRAFLVVLIGGLFLSMGNLPAPHYACAGLAEGDRCTYGYGCSGNGVCRYLENCEDNLSDGFNECFVCQTGSAARR